MKTHQLTKKNNHRPNWPNFFLMLGTGILTLIVLFKERGLVTPYELFHCELSPKKSAAGLFNLPFRFFRWNELNS